MSNTATSAQDTYVGIEDPNNPGTYVDVSTKGSNARMPMTRTDIDTSSFGQGDMTNVSGMRDGTFTFDVFGDAAINTLLFNIYMSRNPVNVRYGPGGNVTGQQYFQAKFNITQWEPGGGANTANTASTSWHRTGGTTIATFA